ncbi:MAG: hypothetical protein KIS77_09520 [Saprospiraceae bacterium]|nr:hypothetical protein [Saprospiraceae bacterium]
MKRFYAVLPTIPLTRMATLLLLLSFFNCKTPQPAASIQVSTAPFLWENANIYFLLTDRFYNGDRKNDRNFGRTAPTAPLRGFMGGDLKGITKKLEEGYFDQLGITAIWFTPVVEQIHGFVDEGTGATYGFHGYWTKDWTRLDPNFGTETDLAELVEKAHKRGIRVVLDVVINHTGPATEKDPVWPNWVRTGPPCTYTGYKTTIECTLVENLPDIKTERNEPVELPPFLVEKWKREGRYEKEVAELDAFFKRTGYPRAPRFYIIKWLTDYIRKFGVDAYRCDTAKHIEESVWAELRKEADLAFSDWKRSNPGKVLDKNDFFMFGEVYNYNISAGRLYDFGDRQVDFYSYGFNSLINFELKNDAQTPSYEAIFSKYSNLLHNQLRNLSVVNYLTSHDDGSPFDKERKKPFEAGTKLLLCPGSSQVYYGDETNRTLIVPGTQGDATLRSFMNWEELASNAWRGGHKAQDVLAHWQKLGRFRREHPAVGAGVHTMLSEKPYLFKRMYVSDLFWDTVVVGLDWPRGKKEVPMHATFADGTVLTDYYSGQQVAVKDGRVVLDTPFEIVLLGK